MARIFIEGDVVAKIVEQWLADNGGDGWLLMWDIDEEGVFGGAVIENYVAPDCGLPKGEVEE